MSAFLVFLGGGLGALSRWGLSAGLEKLTNRTALHQFPLGTLACNLLGCFLIGCVLGHFAQKTPLWVTPLLITGFLGGFTTFSTFAHEVLLLIKNGNTLYAVFYVILSSVLGVMLVSLGMKLSS